MKKKIIMPYEPEPHPDPDLPSIAPKISRGMNSIAAKLGNMPSSYVDKLADAMLKGPLDVIRVVHVDRPPGKQP